MENLKYFQDGVKLLRKNLYLCFLGIGLTLIMRVIFESHQFLLEIILVLILFGFTLSIPKFLDLKEKNKNVDYKIIIKTTLKNSLKSLYISFLAILVFSICLTIEILIGKIINLTLPNFPSLTDFNLTIFSIFISPLFLFFPILLSVKELGVIKSISKSIKFSTKNFSFIYLVLPYHLILTLVNQLLLKNNLKTVNIISVTYYTVTFFCSLIISCAFYLYFTKNYKD